MSERVRGKAIEINTAVANVEMHIEQLGEANWSGTCIAAKPLTVGKTYRLQLDDGRIGEFIVDRSIAAQGERVYAVSRNGRALHVPAAAC